MGRVADLLRQRGWKVEEQPSGVLVARHSGKEWHVRVEPLKGAEPAWPPPEELERLRAAASRSRQVPVVAFVSPEAVRFMTVRARRELSP